MKIRKTVLGAASSALALSLLSLGAVGVAGAGAAKAKTVASYHIGTIYHSNVADAPYQWEQAFSAYWAVKDAEGGVDGHKVVLTQDDNQSSASTTVTDFKALASNKSTLAVAGMDVSTNTAPIVPLANQDKITLFLGAAVLQSSVIPSPTPYVFESSELFTDSIAAMAAYAKSKGWTKVGLMYFEGTDATEANAIVQKYLPSVGLQIVTTQYLPFSTGTLDYTSEVSAAQSAGAQVLFGLQGPTGFIAIHQAEVGLGMNVPILGNPSGLNASVYSAMGSAFYAADSPWYLNPSAPGWHAMATALKKQYLITSNNITADDVGGWVDGEIFAAALKSCGTPTVCTRAKFRLALQGIKNLSFGGLMSPVSFSATNHYAPSKTEFFSENSSGALGAIDAPIPYPVKGQ